MSGSSTPQEKSAEAPPISLAEKFPVVCATSTVESCKRWSTLSATQMVNPYYLRDRRPLTPSIKKPKWSFHHDYFVRNTKIRFSTYLQTFHYLPRYHDINYPKGGEATPHLRIGGTRSQIAHHPDHFFDLMGALWYTYYDRALMP